MMDLAFVVLTLMAGAALAADDKCVETQPGIFQTSSTSFIDLTPLKDRILQATAFLGTVHFLYSPCTPFKCVHPGDALVCKAQTWSSHTVLIGNGQNATCNKRRNDVVLLYEQQGRTVHVELECTKHGQTTLKHDTVLRFHDYRFTLSSPYACEKGRPTIHTTSSTNTTELTTVPTNTTEHTTGHSNTTEHTTSPTNTTEHTTSPTNTTEHTTSPTNTTEHTTSPTNTTEHTTSPTNTTEHTTSPTNTTEHTTSPTDTTEHTTATTMTTEHTKTPNITTVSPKPTNTSPGSTSETSTTGRAHSVTLLLSFASLTALALFINRLITF